MTNSPFPGVKELQLGAGGTGKTTSIASWLDAGITPFCIFTEPSYTVLGDAKFGNVLAKIHYAYCPPGTVSWADMMETAKRINQLSYKGLCQLDDINKRRFNQLYDFLTLHNNFKCLRTGKEFGDVDKWGTDRVLVWDSLTGLSYMAISNMVGSKPVRDQGDYGVAMDNLENIIRRACFGTRCHFHLIAHMEPERDEITGSSQLMASTLGRKLAPKLPQMFSDVIIAKRIADKFSWSVIEPNTQALTRNLPFAADISPTWTHVVKAWMARGGIIEQQAPTVAAA